MLDITCEKCNAHVCYYQKDGPGPLKRMYLDRMNGINTGQKKLKCDKCDQDLGIKINYQKENRPAYRLFQNSVSKRVIAQSKLIKFDNVE